MPAISPLRLGVIGFGRLARRYYVPALRNLPGLGGLLVADPLGASRDAARRALPGARVYADPADLLAAGPHGVIVASPPTSHLALWQAAARYGVPVLMEKPFVLRGELAAACAPEARRLLMIDFNRRFWPPYRRAASLLRRGAIGQVVSLELTLLVDVRRWCGVTAHRLDPAEGGPLYDLGSQVVDLAAWLVGMDPTGVRATARRRGPYAEEVHVELAFPGGTVARCHVGYGDRTLERLEIQGSRGRLRMPDPNMALHLERRAAAPWAVVPDLALLGWRGVFRSRSMSRRSIALAIDAFVDGIRRRVPFTPGFPEAARSARLLEAATRSIELGAAVDLAEAEARMDHV